MSSTTSPSLLLRIRNPDDNHAWDEFLSIYTTIVKDYCFQRRLSHADTEDIVQEVMQTVSKAIKSFEYDKSVGRFRAWLGTIAANTIKTHLAREARKAKAQNSTTSTDTYDSIDTKCSDPDSTWVEIYSERIFRVACSRIRHRFSDKTWKCFEASWVNNEPAADIAEKLNIPVHSVYVNKSRVLEKLEAEIRWLADDLPVINKTDG